MSGPDPKTPSASLCFSFFLFLATGSSLFISVSSPSSSCQQHVSCCAPGEPKGDVEALLKFSLRIEKSIADPAESSTSSVLEARAAAWEEAEKAKYMARYRREKVKIEAWENHQKTKAEAEMRRIEVKTELMRSHALEKLMNKLAGAERMRSHAHEKLMNKLAGAQHRAEEKRAAAKAKRSHEAAKTAQQAEYIRQTGRIPSPFSHWSCCS